MQFTPNVDGKQFATTETEQSMMSSTNEHGKTNIVELVGNPLAKMMITQSTSTVDGKPFAIVETEQSTMTMRLWAR